MGHSRAQLKPMAAVPRYYDAFSKVPVPVVGHMGSAVPLQGLTTMPVTTDTAKTTIVLFAPGGGTSSWRTNVISRYTATEGGADVARPGNRSYENIAALSDVCDSVMPMAGSLRIRNYTQRLNQGGVVRCLKLHSGVNLTGTILQSEFESLAARIREDVRTRVYDGAELMSGRQVNAEIVDSAVNDFETLDVTKTQSAFNASCNHPRMTVIALLFEPFASDNAYEVQVANKIYARFHTMTALANTAVSPPVATWEKINKARAIEAGAGSALTMIGGYMSRAAVGGAEFVAANPELLAIAA